ncbi:MAG: hypothetical protein IT204_12380 [Fimbriimonadaceae bacterium]|nr:hypothetical protein [Fimbriimonadaceae bacterium]
MSQRHVLLVLIGLWSLPAIAQAPLDNAPTPGFGILDTRLFAEELPPRAEVAVPDPTLADLLTAGPLFTEGRELLLQLAFDSDDLAANPQRLVFFEPEGVSLAGEGSGQALRLEAVDPAAVGVARTLDATRLAGRLVELSARVRLDGVPRPAPDASPFAQPLIALRYERPHPERARRAAGETQQVERSIFWNVREEVPPAAFLPDSRWHTYRGRCFVPSDVLTSSLLISLDNCAATMLVDDLAVSLVTTRSDRLLQAGCSNLEGNLLGPGASFELGLTRGAVTSGRVLSPLPNGPVGRDFGEWRMVDDNAAEGRRALAVLVRANRGAAVELPWMGLAAGQPYTMSVWLRAGRDDVRAAFGVADARWKMLGSPVVLETRWRRFAATFTPPAAPQQAFWPWVSLEPPGADTQVWIDGLQLEAGGEVGPPRPWRGVELALSDGREPGPGVRRFYRPGEPVRITAQLLQRTTAERTVRLRGVLESHTGRLFQPLPEVPPTLLLAPETSAELVLHDGPLPRGMYRYWLTATDEVSGETARAQLLLAVVDPPRTHRFGFHDGPGPANRTAAVAATADQVGAGLVRLAATPAAAMEQHWLDDTSYDWSLLEPTVTDWSGSGVGVVQTLGPRLDSWPGWLLAKYGAQFGVPLGGGPRILPPTRTWGSYVSEVAGRLSGRVTAYEVFSGADAVLAASEYRDLLATARDAIRQRDPQALVIGPGAELPASALPGQFLEQLLTDDGQPLLDVLSTSFSASWPEQLDAARDGLRGLAAAHHLRLWDTAHGYAEGPLLTDRLNPRASEHPALAPASASPWDAAALTARHELLLAAAGWERSFLSSSVAEAEYLHSPVGPLVESDGSPRPTLVVLATLAAELGDAPPLGEWRWDLSLPVPAGGEGVRRPQGVRAVAFATAPDRCLLALWSWPLDGAVHLQVPAATTARACLITGEAVRLPADGGLLLVHAPLLLAEFPREALEALSQTACQGVLPRRVDPPGGRADQRQAARR